MKGGPLGLPARETRASPQRHRAHREYTENELCVRLRALCDSVVEPVSIRGLKNAGIGGRRGEERRFRFAGETHENETEGED
jgi:hypothetical protein